MRLRSTVAPQMYVFLIQDPHIQVTNCLEAPALEQCQHLTYKNMHPRRLTKLSTAILILLTSNPHVDGTTVPVQPWSVGKKVPMIFGSNQDEGALFALGTFQTANVSASQYSNFSTPTLDLQHPYAYFNTR